MSHTQQTPMDRFYNEFESLTTEQQQEFFKTVQEFYRGDKNINLKTDIKNPPIHSALDLLGEYFGAVGMTDGRKWIRMYSKSLKEQMVSDNRKGRTEFKDLMSAKLQQVVRSTWDRLTGRHQNEQP